MKNIVCFHVGRGGRYWNPGHVSYVGEIDMNKVIEWESNNLFYRDRDARGRFCAPYYADCSGNEMITIKEANTGVGQLNWDNQYNTDICKYLEDCSESELELIRNSDVYKSYELRAELEKLN